MDIDFNKKRIKKIKNKYNKVIKKINDALLNKSEKDNFNKSEKDNFNKSEKDEYLKYIFLINKTLNQLEVLLDNINFNLNNINIKKKNKKNLNSEVLENIIMDDAINKYKSFILSYYLLHSEVNRL
tara:strand:- start:1288 stop:1665 length:378 start_codon:yes stop_codon:yes gene_type:complete